MMYLIIKETPFTNIDSVYFVCNFTNESLYHVVSFTDNLDKANYMLQGYNLIEKDKDVVYSIVRYEQPLKLTKEMEC